MFRKSFRFRSRSTSLTLWRWSHLAKTEISLALSVSVRLIEILKSGALPSILATSGARESPKGAPTTGLEGRRFRHASRHAAVS